MTPRPATVPERRGSATPRLEPLALPKTGGPGPRRRRAPEVKLQKKLLMQVEGVNQLAEEAAAKRGNIKHLRDFNRIYDDDERKEMETKYLFFSGTHMRRIYKQFAHAKHDPFNKSPDWSRSIFQRLSAAFEEKGISPDEILNKTDVDRDGELNRGEMKKVVLEIMPTMSDGELTAIYDAVDTDNTGEVSIRKFCSAMQKEASANIVPQEAAVRYRNPVFRTHRFAPAVIDGWDHELDKPLRDLRLDKICETERDSILLRLAEEFQDRGFGVESMPSTSRPQSRGFAAETLSSASRPSSRGFAPGTVPSTPRPSRRSDMSRHSTVSRRSMSAR